MVRLCCPQRVEGSELKKRASESARAPERERVYLEILQNGGSRCRGCSYFEGDALMVW
jgi:hypothetical protein